MSGDHDRIDAFVRARRVTALALETDAEAIRRRHHGAGADGEAADRDPRHVMQAINLLDGETLDEAFLHHLAGAAAALLGGLKYEDRSAVKVARLGQVASRAEQHGGVAVMAAGVHLPGSLRPVGHIARLLDRQGVHVGPEADHPAGGDAPAPDDADNARAAKAGHHLVAAERLELVGDDPRRAVNVEEQLGMLVEIAAPGGDVIDEVGDAVDDWHENLLGLR